MTTNLTFTPAEQEAMPAALRAALLTWQREHQALQTDRRIQHTLSVPNKASAAQFVIAGLHAVHGVIDGDRLVEWIDAWARAGAPEYAGVEKGAAAPRQKVLETIIEAKRLDLLHAVLQHPKMSPTADERLNPPPSNLMMQTFNGALGNRLMMRRSTTSTKHGYGFLTQTLNLWNGLEANRSPLISTFINEDHLSTEIEWAKKESAIGHLIYRQRMADPARPFQETVEIKQTWAAELSNARGGRAAANLNVVGLAVLHNWSTGLAPLLEHFDPYAHDGERRSFLSPLVLASVYNAPRAVVELLQHPSFCPLQRFGYSTTQALGQQEHTLGRGERLWNAIDRHTVGGYEWTLLCGSKVSDNLEVQSAMLECWDRLSTQQRRTLTQDATSNPQAVQRLESMVLHRVVQGSLHALPLQTERPRL